MATGAECCAAPCFATLWGYLSNMCGGGGTTAACGCTADNICNFMQCCNKGNCCVTNTNTNQGAGGITISGDVTHIKAESGPVSNDPDSTRRNPNAVQRAFEMAQKAQEDDAQNKSLGDSHSISVIQPSATGDGTQGFEV